ncbi:MAG: insulinase family protein [Planctomycetes bacterium]|nr:insulinase family protein [Planctomycetota bacterium]
MNPRHPFGLLAAAALVAACAGSPRREEPPTPPLQPRVLPEPEVKSSQAPIAARTVARLDNGITVVLAKSPNGRDAQLQFGFLAGTAFVAPGACELAAYVLAHGADPAQGRPSLAQTMERLGGTLAVRVGPLTAWLDLRVPATRWQEALSALKRALAGTADSRNQVERLRAELVAARSAAIRAQPGRAMAELLLLAESGSATYVNALLDRDPAEVAQFRARLFRPERAVLFAEVPADAAAATKALGKGGAVDLAAWTPELPVPGPTGLLDRRFEPGLYVARDPTAAAGPARRVLLVQYLPPLSTPDAAEMLTMHACLTLDGSGGRLERMQQDTPLVGVVWQPSVVQTPDATALVLEAMMAPTDVVPIWRLVQNARASLLAVPPTDSELDLALARVPLTARLGLVDDAARLRSAAQLALLGTDLAAFDAKVAAIRTMPKLDMTVPARNFLALPFAMVVVGGDVPDLPAEARTYDVLPQGHEPAANPVADTGTPQHPAPAPTPWIDQAIAAVGSKELVQRLSGFRHTARLVHEQAPDMTETTMWQNDGSLVRQRTLVGETIETTLAGDKWSEKVGTTTRSLDAAEAGWLRREQHRHPLALLAAAARGEILFRPVAQRDSGDRTVMVLEAKCERFERLRVHLDTQSHLVRVVETWETLPDGTALHLHEDWSDYRLAAGLRAPFRRLCTQDDGQNRVETLFQTWTPDLRGR